MICCGAADFSPLFYECGSKLLLTDFILMGLEKKCHNKVNTLFTCSYFMLI